METPMWSISPREAIHGLVVQRNLVGIIFQVSPYYWMAFVDVEANPVVFEDLLDARQWVETHWRKEE